MKDKNLSFGEYIKRKRLFDQRELTLQDIAYHLNVSASYISAVENRIKHPFSGEMMDRFAQFLNLSAEETALMYDIAGRETHEVPYDIEDTFFHEPFGDLIRHVIRLFQDGMIKYEDFQAFIRQMEAKNKQQS